MTGHCRHCTVACKATRVLSGNPAIIHANGNGVRWLASHCPACIAGEQIAVKIEQVAAGLASGLGLDSSRIRDHVGSDADILRGMLTAAAIARGET